MVYIGYKYLAKQRREFNMRTYVVKDEYMQADTDWSTQAVESEDDLFGDDSGSGSGSEVVPRKWTPKGQ